VSETRPTPGPDLDAEREVDLRSVWQRIAARWWLPVGGLLIGAVLGVLVSVGGGKVYEATTLLFVGQPFAPSGGGQIQSLATNPKTVSQIIRSESAIRRAATASGLRPGQLRGNVTSQAVTSPGATARNLSPLIEITVQAPSAAKAERAAGSLSNSVIGQVSAYVDRKIELLNEQIKNDNEGLETANTRVQGALAQQKQVLEQKSLSLAERILIQANANSTLQFYEARASNLRADRAAAQQLLSLAEEVERSRVVEPPSSVRTTATSRRNSAVIGALLGLLAGVLAAYLADPLLRRRGGSPQAA
jgi:capsular polysaccharide biosynthesis protein